MCLGSPMCKQRVVTQGGQVRRSTRKINPICTRHKLRPGGRLHARARRSGHSEEQSTLMTVGLRVGSHAGHERSRKDSQRRLYTPGLISERLILKLAHIIGLRISVAPNEMVRYAKVPHRTPKEKIARLDVIRGHVKDRPGVGLYGVDRFAGVENFWANGSIVQSCGMSQNPRERYRSSAWVRFELPMEALERPKYTVGHSMEVVIIADYH